MQSLPYCAVAQAVFVNSRQQTSIVDWLVSAGEALDRYFQYPLIRPAAVVTWSAPASDGVVVTPYPVSRLTAIKIDGASQATLPTIGATGETLAFESISGSAHSFEATADWGYGKRLRNIVTPAALAADADEIANPAPLPKWWREGQPILLGDETAVIEAVGDAETTLLREDGDALAADGVIYEVRAPARLRRACSIVANRIFEQETKATQRTRDDARLPSLFQDIEALLQ